ncbi:hypothetical protein ACFL4O_02380 [bacterium]
MSIKNKNAVFTSKKKKKSPAHESNKMLIKAAAIKEDINTGIYDSVFSPKYTKTHKGVKIKIGKYKPNQKSIKENKQAAAIR